MQEVVSIPGRKINGIDEFIVGASEPMVKLFDQLDGIVNSTVTINVLIRGETGVGKELVAKYLHYNRLDWNKNKPFIPINANAIPSELMESELFGHNKGAFTGAISDKKGLFEKANGGTLFLDEIGDLPYQLQIKLLRIIDDGVIYHLGNINPIKVSFRLMTATNQNLEARIEDNKFRRDLYQRVKGYQIQIPPLRDRIEDIPHIIAYFISILNNRHGQNIAGVDSDAMRLLQNYDWPGNVRELENVIKGASIKIKGTGIIQEKDINEIFNEMGLMAQSHSSDEIIPVRKYVEGTTLSGSFSTPNIKVSTQKLWYEDGVMPVIGRDLHNFVRMSSRSMYKTVGNGNFYFQSFKSQGGTTFELAFLTPANLFYFFTLPDPPSYDHLLNIIKTGDFNSIVKNPFKIYNIPTMVSNPNSYNSYDKVERAMIRSKAHLLKTMGGRYIFFVLTLDKVEYFVPPGDNRDQKIDSLTKEILQNYKQFRNWKPIETLDIYQVRKRPPFILGI